MNYSIFILHDFFHFLPVFIPTMDLSNLGNINPIPDVPQPTIYSITLTYYDITSAKTYVSEQTYVNWVPQEKNSIPPSNTAQTANVAGFQDTNTTYYYCYNFQWFITLVNTAFTDAFISLQNVVKVDDITLPVSNAPFFTWNIS